jgi:hypothetical protein
LGFARITHAARAYWQGNGGWELAPIGAFQGDKLVAGLALFTRRIPYSPWRLGRILAILPLADDVAGSTLALLREAEKVARRQRVLEIDARCMVPEAYPIDGVAYDAGLCQALREAGYLPTEVRDGTYILPINMADEALAESLGKKCRRDVRKGIREGVVVRAMETAEELKLFIDTHREMCLRKDLPAWSQARYEGLPPLFERGDVRVFASSYNAQVCNMALIESLGIPRYLLGATTAAAFEKGVPPTGQVLHYAIMQWFRDRGARYYDLGGSPGPEPQEGHPNYTVWRFKHEFGGTYAYWVPYHRRPLGAAGGLLTKLARRLGKLG